MSIEQEHTFDALVQTWLRHDDLRRAGASVATLATSRRELDARRLAAHRAS